MPCILALIVFSILGIFSASHRSLAREAFSCVFRGITFRPCDTGFKEKIKGKVLSKLVQRSSFLARLVNKNYEILSWIFFILMVGSTFWVLRGGYNFYVYGSCNGLNSSGFCAFDPKGENNDVSTLENGAFCPIIPEDQQELSLAGIDLSIFPTKNIEAKETLFFVGCYACEYSRKAYPAIEKLLNKKEVNYVFAHYPAKGDTNFLGEAGYCVYENYGDKFWDFNSYLFSAEKEFVLDKNNLNSILENFNFDTEKINDCINDPETSET